MSAGLRASFARAEARTPQAVLQRDRRDLRVAEHIPYAALVTPQVVSTRSGDYLTAWRIGGLAFEAADDAELNAWHERLNTLWRNLASPDLALWVHLVRRPGGVVPARRSRVGLAAALEACLGSRLASTALMINELTVTLVYRPEGALPLGGLTRALIQRTVPEAALRERQQQALTALDKLATTVEAGLARYEPRRLGLEQFTDAAGRSRATSALLEFLGELVNGTRSTAPRALPRASVAEALPERRLMFGREAVEIRDCGEVRYAGFLGLREYPTPTAPGLLNRLLTAPFSCTLTQSFTFLPKPTAQGLLSRQYHRLVNAGDLAVSQAAELTEAMDMLASNLFVVGDHHLSLQVQVQEQPGEGATRALARLAEDLSRARAIIADVGAVVAREDLALEAAWWAQLPGNFAYRPRRAPITSRNFAGLAPFHGYPSGRLSGNHWGEALLALPTRAGSPYYFSLHASDPREPGGGSRRDIGHTFICGPTGSGKTVFLGTCLALLAGQGVAQVVFDKDQGLEILVRALGGVYLPISLGTPTGFNPLQLPDGPEHREFLRTWLTRLAARPGRALTVREEGDLEQALAGTLALPRTARRLSRLLEFLDPTDPEGLHGRLARWCGSAGGEDAWAFDNAEDGVNHLFSHNTLVGFDVTQFLEIPHLRDPLTLYLFHLVRGQLDGRPLVVWMDEFARLLADPAFADFARDGLKTWRKLNAVAAFATQSTSDVLASPISRTLIEQTATQVFFPNTAAVREEYVDGFGLSEREYALIAHELVPGTRQCLIRQGGQSVVCTLDLAAAQGLLRVISGRADTVQQVRELIRTRGADPAHWLSEFIAASGPVPPEIAALTAPATCPHNVHPATPAAGVPS